MRNLCIDIGNTRAKLAIFDNHKIVFSKTLAHFFEDDLVALIKKHKINNSIVCSTRKDLKKIVPSNLDGHHMFLTSKLAIPIKNKYKTPTSLGSDRIASAVGANVKFPNKNCLIIDAGTCVTMDFLHKKKGFEGGNISPGIQMRIKAMHKFTGKLPLVPFKLPKNTIGKSTEEALQNGAIRGTICEIESFIRLIKKRNKQINIILTGGDAKFLAGHLKKKIFVSPKLVLKGLNEILLYNLAKS